VHVWELFHAAVPLSFEVIASRTPNTVHFHEEIMNNEEVWVANNFNMYAAVNHNGSTRHVRPLHVHVTLASGEPPIHYVVLFPDGLLLMDYLRHAPPQVQSQFNSVLIRNDNNVTWMTTGAALQVRKKAPVVGAQKGPPGVNQVRHKAPFSVDAAGLPKADKGAQRVKGAIKRQLRRGNNNPNKQPVQPGGFGPKPPPLDKGPY
jgi:hypothetical protein